MLYGPDFDIFVRTSHEKTNKEKIEILKTYPLKTLLSLERNIEEYPRLYEEEIIKAVTNAIFKKGIICL